MHPLWETVAELVFPDAQHILAILEENRLRSELFQGVLKPASCTVKDGYMYKSVNFHTFRMNYLLDLRSFVSSKPISGLTMMRFKAHERHLDNKRIFVTIFDIYFAGQNMNCFSCT